MQNIFRQQAEGMQSKIEHLKKEVDRLGRINLYNYKEVFNRRDLEIELREDLKKAEKALRWYRDTNNMLTHDQAREYFDQKEDRKYKYICTECAQKLTKEEATLRRNGRSLEPYCSKCDKIESKLRQVMSVERRDKTKSKNL